MDIKENVNLKEFNSFGISAQARYLIKIQHLDQLKSLLADPVYKQNQHLVLGGGSNLLFASDFEGLVIKIELKGISEEIIGDEVILKVAAGESWHDLVLYSIQRGFSGLENLSLIPGTVGAAPIQNIGAYGVELEERFLKLEAIEKETGALKVFSKEACQFDYRYSIFKQNLKNKFIVTHVYLRLSKVFKPNIEYRALKTMLTEQDLENLNAKLVSDKVIAIRQSKLPNPTEIGNAGSFYKNPVITNQLYEGLKKKWEEIPGYPVDGEFTKIPAGWLIEQAGWKGKRMGNVGVHQKQALVLVNYGEGKGEELLELARLIQDDVKQKFRIELEPEVNIIISE